MCIKSPQIFLLAIAMGMLQSVSAAENLTLDQRVMRMENLLVNQAEQAQKIDQMRAELTDMREMLEKQTYEMEQIKQRQRNLYQDMDRRLSELESGKQISGAVAPIAPPVSAVAPAVSAAPVLAPADTSADPDGKAVYDKAFGLLKDGRYAPAITEFRNFIQRYPQSKLLDNAQYWLAEACYGSRDYPTALKEFQKILTHYKDSGKLQGAELKIGYTYYEMQDWANARTTLESVKSRYPNTTVATKAEERLQRMKREGH
jgi:tol-pal system protein YbgF